MEPSSSACGPGELPTASVPKNIYDQVKKRCRRILIQHFLCVASPIDAPEEEHFDHINFLATWPTKPDLDMESLAAKMSLEPAFALASFDKATKGFNIAVRWPGQHQSPGLYTDKCIHVNVQLCRTLQSLQWMLFRRAHGGLWSCIRSLMRPYGLICDRNALYLKVDEIQALRKDEARFWLTSDPSEILKFLGLFDQRRWAEPFDTVADMFDYISQCRVFYSRTDGLPGLNGGMAGEHAQINDAILQCRPLVLQRFVEERLPRLREAHGFFTPRMSKKKVVREAMRYFNIEARVQLVAGRLLIEQQREHIVLYYINGGIPEVTDPTDDEAQCYRVCQIHALTEIFKRGETKYGVFPTDGLRFADGQFDMARVEEFIRKNMRQVGDAAYRFHSAWCLEVQGRLEAERRDKQRVMARSRGRKRNHGRQTHRVNNENWSSNGCRDDSKNYDSNGSHVKKENRNSNGAQEMNVIKDKSNNNGTQAKNGIKHKSNNNGTPEKSGIKDKSNKSTNGHQANTSKQDGKK